MESSPLDKRKRTLEESHFRAAEAQQLRRIRDQNRLEQTREELSAELGLGKGVLLERLLDLGITREIAIAFEALPLVEVAWADGNVDAEERSRVVDLSTASGLDLGGPAHAQLNLWLERRPEQALFEAWYAFAAAQQVGPETSERARRVVEGARDVAAAAGGLLGVGAVSGAERAIIARIELGLRGPSGQS